MGHDEEKVVELRKTGKPATATAPQTLAKRTVSSVLAVFPRTLLGFCINTFHRSQVEIQTPVHHLIANIDLYTNVDIMTANLDSKALCQARAAEAFSSLVLHSSRIRRRLRDTDPSQNRILDIQTA
jgi:hypothetical protein